MASVLAGLVVFLGFPRVIQAGGGPESVVLVVNADSPASLSIANEYIALRNIPPRNVVYLTDITDEQRWDLENFKEKILQPVLSTIEQRRLMHIDYIVYSAGFPTAIRIQSHAREFVELAGVPEEHHRVFSSWASINALTYFARNVMADQPDYLALDANFYMRVPATQLLTQPFGGELQQQFEAAVRDYRAERYEAAIRTWTAMAERHPRQVAVQYYLARAHARAGDFDQAAASLTEAIRHGWSYREFTREDQSFSAWRDQPSFRDLLNKIPDLPFKYTPTLGFSARDIWGPNGMRNGEPQQGKQFFLSTVLAVARNRGTTEQQAIRNLRLSAAADSSFPEGTFYFTSTSNVRSQARQPFLADTVTELRRLGFNTQIVQERYPRNRGNVIGMSFGVVNYDFEEARLRIRPGAIVENFTSYGGAMQAGASQTPLSEAIRHGAAGSSGTVHEPFAIPNKFPHPMIHVHYVRGSSLAEAFYQSVHSPAMLLIVGDPLCQPWARRPEFQVDRIAGSESTPNATLDAEQSETNEAADIDVVSGRVTVQPNIRGDVPAARIDIYLDGQYRGTAAVDQPISFDTTTIPDGFHELRLVAIANDRIQAETSLALPLWVNNRGHDVRLSIRQPSPVQINDTLQIDLETNLESPITLLHNGRQLGRIDGPRGSTSIEARQLGRGTTRLQAAVQHNGQWMFSRPIQVEVTY